MKRIGIALMLSAAAAMVFAGATRTEDPATGAVEKGLRWLVSVQGRDGGWGQDGGETPFVRAGERLETSGNDVANTAVALQALLHSGHTPTQGEYRAAVRRATEFLLRQIESSPEQGLAVTSMTGTQIQRKLGPYIDTFLSSRVLSELDGNMGDTALNARVRQALQKCVRKIETNQQRDGSWNISGGWAPILGTSIASRSLYDAQKKGVKVDQAVMARVDEYTKRSAAEPVAAPGGARAMGSAASADAGVSLYKGAQNLEQMTRTEKDRRANASEIRKVVGSLNDSRFVNGFGSMGGEEFFSYLNISDSLHRTGGEEWNKWNSQIKVRLARLQNNDGTWAGHHCITGRVAVTSAAVLTLRAEHDPLDGNFKKAALKP
ncbi:MAG: prenyltransferase/squalene oxidase repeat-containing protein [Bryobacteraceae bacterium]